MKKKEANYKIIMGMHAVGNQCKNCLNSDTSSQVCLVVEGKINPNGHCDHIDYVEEAKA